MTEQTKHKSPEELGEAVGRKIEELFGGMFQDEATIAIEPSPPPTPAPARPPQAAAPPRQHVVDGTARQAPVPKRAETPPRRAPEAPRPPAPTPQRPAVVGPEFGRPANNFEELIEQIEAVVLNLEWEVSQKSVSDLSKKLGEVEKFIPASGTARNIVAMHNRVLSRFNSPDAAPHPALMKLLHGSVAALKSLYTSKGKGPLPAGLSEVITQSYRKIMAAPASELVTPRTTDSPLAGDGGHTLRGMINDAGNSIHSLEEVSQRLARILGALRQGGDMSAEEMTRRLGTLEHLLSDRVGQLTTVHKALAQAAISLDDRMPAGASHEGKTKAEGLLMLLWGGTPLAVPSSVVVAALPLTRAQAEQFKDKTAITLGARSIPRLPLKKPQSADQAGPSLPGWLIHLAWDGKNFFLLADRSLGYRRTPEGVDVQSQGKIKIGATFYTVLNPARFR